MTVKSSIEFLTNPQDLPNLQMISSSSSSRSSSISSEDSTKRETRQRKKRRQRTGPSCDHCRSRKVKCDADIKILQYNQLTDEEKRIFKTQDNQIIELDYQDNPIYKIDDNWRIVKTKLDNSIHSHNDFKYIKFKICKKCLTKGWNCKFSKGFTRIHSMNVLSSK